MRTGVSVARLVQVELRRFWSRGLIRWAVVALVAFAVLTAVLASVTSRPLAPEQVADAQQQLELAEAEWEESGPEQIEQCKQGEEEAQKTEPDADFGCDQIAPTIDWFIQPKPTFADEASADPSVYAPPNGISTLQNQTPLIALFAFLVGVSFITAETSSGAIGLWLTFEPRRSRVYWSKAIAAGIGVLPPALLAYLVMAGGSWAAYALNGQPGHVTSATWSTLAWTGGRLLVLAMLVAFMGVAMGALTKHAAAALGVAVGWFLVVEGLLAATFPLMQAWLLRFNGAAWINGGTSFFVNRCATDENGMSCQSYAHEITQTQGGLVLLGATALISVAAVLVFRRRDVR